MYVNDCMNTVPYRNPAEGYVLWLAKVAKYCAEVNKVRLCPVITCGSFQRMPKPFQALQKYGTSDEPRTWGALNNVM